MASRRLKSSRKSASRRLKSSRKSPSRSGKVKLVKIVKSPRPGKKLMAVFSDGSKTHFGAAGMSDYTRHKDPARKKRYEARHRSRENWRNPKSAGSLSKYILWNKPSLRDSIADYKRKFNL